MPCLILFYFTCLCSLLQWSWKMSIIKVIVTISVFFEQWKMMSDLNMSIEKISDFVSYPLFGFALVIKLRDSAFESHWNTLIFFNKRRYDVRFEYVRWKYVWWCCFIFIVLVYFSHETKKFRFSNSLKYFTLISFDKKKWCQIWISPVKHCLIWFKLHWLSRILEISWEIRILNFIEIVSIKESVAKSKFVLIFLSYLYFLALL